MIYSGFGSFVDRPVEPWDGVYRVANRQGYLNPAEIARTADVEGVTLTLYKMGDLGEWPAQADVVRALDGFTCRPIEGGAGLTHLATPAGRLAVVSPQAVAMAAGQAAAAGRITREREDALRTAVGA